MNIIANWLKESHDITGPELSNDMVRQAEKNLGYKLPQSYVDLLRIKNGGRLKTKCFPIQASTGWSEDHIQVEAIYGIGGSRGIDAELGSQYMIAEWGYPETGIVIGLTPSAGHDTVMLDYSLCGPTGEPQVIYVETETNDSKPYILVLASNFEVFIHSFTPFHEGT